MKNPIIKVFWALEVGILSAAPGCHDLVVGDRTVPYDSTSGNYYPADGGQSCASDFAISPQIEADTSGPGILSGVWAVRSFYYYDLDFPGLFPSDQSAATSKEIMIYKISHTADLLTETIQPCFFANGPVVGASSTFKKPIYSWQCPDSAACAGRSLFFVNEATTLNNDKHYRSDALEKIFGVDKSQLAAPEGSLPSVASDPAVWDQDGDNKPGVSLKISSNIASGTRYLIRRAKEIWEGEIRSASLIEGRITSMLVQEESLGGEPAILAQSGRFVYNYPEKSEFKMVRVGPGTTCNHLLGVEENYFGDVKELTPSH